MKTDKRRWDIVVHDTDYGTEAIWGSTYIRPSVRRIVATAARAALAEDKALAERYAKPE